MTITVKGTAVYTKAEVDALLSNYVLKTPPTPPPVIPPPVTPPTSGFTIVNGNIVKPNSTTIYIGAGINISDIDMASCLTSAAGGPLTTLFPGINMVRVACYTYQPPSYYQQFVTWATGLGIVVMLENHQNFNANGGSAGASGGGTGVILAGTMLTTESNWYAALATAFINNPYVWFMTNNEPPQGNLAAWQQATYNAIRGTGNQTIIAMEAYYGGGVPDDFTPANIPPSIYGPMTNIIWDFHQYTWIVNGQSAIVPLATCKSDQVGFVNKLQAVTASANGKIPVIVGETGNSTTGPTIDTSGQTLINAVIANVGASLPFQGAAFWEWNNGGVAGDKLTNMPKQQSLTSPYGTSVAAFIAGNTANR